MYKVCVISCVLFPHPRLSHIKNTKIIADGKKYKKDACRKLRRIIMYTNMTYNGIKSKIRLKLVYINLQKTPYNSKKSFLQIDFDSFSYVIYAFYLGFQGFVIILHFLGFDI